MRNSCIGITLTLALGLSTVAIAHGTEKHGKAATSAAQMKKQHAMMPMFSVASAKLEAALDKGDVAAVEAEAGKIMVVLPDLKKSKPHKNVKERKKFVELATDFEKTVASTLDLAKKGDFAGAKTAFKKGEEICAACHARFRD
jgi:soluble cytochrome b562